MAFSNYLMDFLLPTRCCICGKPPSLVCQSCSISSEIAVRQGYLSATSYTPEFASLIAAFKEKHLVATASALNQLLDPLLSHVRANFAISHIAFPASSRANYQKRGFEPIRYLLSRSKAAAGLSLVAVRLAREPKDQAGLTAAQRRSNLKDAFVAPKVAGRYLAFDDVLSTGSTISELSKAISRGPGQLITSAVLAVNILKPNYQPLEKA